jgi:hypothetical protein
MPARVTLFYTDPSTGQLVSFDPDMSKANFHTPEPSTYTLAIVGVVLIVVSRKLMGPDGVEGEGD